MARTLYEIIKANQEAGATKGSQKTSDFRQTILAKSGQAVAPGLASSGPAKSTIQETAMEQAQGAEQNVLQQQETVQQEALGQEARGVQQGIAIQERKLNIASSDQQAKYLRQVSNITQSLNQNLADIDQNRKNSQIEQAGFLLGLSSKKYVQELEQTANTRRLWDQATFDQELFQSALDADYDLYMNDRGYQRIFNLSQREFQLELARMGIREKLDLMARQIQADNARAVATGAVNATTAGLDYWAKRPSSSGAETAPSSASTSYTPATTATTTRSTGVTPQ